MTVSRLHRIHAVKLGTTLMPAVGSHNLATGIECRNEATSGEVFARFQALYAIKPMAEFQCRGIATALGACALTGVAITSSAPFIMYAKKQDEGGVVNTGSVHRSFTINEGLIVPRRISIDHQGDAVIDYSVHATYDGTNAIVALGESVALPALTDAERFTLGGCTLNDGSTSYTLAQMRRLEIDLGIASETVGADSDLYDTSCRITEIHPVLAAGGIDNHWFKSDMIPLTGLNIAHASTKLFLRKRSLGGGFVADVTAEHIKFTACGIAYIEHVGGSGSGLQEVGMRLPTRFDGTNNPITINTASAIS